MMAVLPKIVHILGGICLVPFNSESELDKEWSNLIKEALEMGISAEEIRQFLKDPKMVDNLSNAHVLERLYYK
ncbi:anti-repressor SinI family protein [Alkalicoccobacillus plakortidis]|uniref:Anti-repressor SinI family protein n=1 Tax=Alkalicoccobacillus plakortidis TaxID=444060 RepID=A0ABT0XQ57_9BACI|nr:anti-repressor SinI family protein [Alkalicoccobacillus plakortidis]MCM2677473.1 anti-repressor SinI family protein [Alkalicoccobacillus plakortidis]